MGWDGLWAGRALWVGAGQGWGVEGVGPEGYSSARGEEAVLCPRLVFNHMHAPIILTPMRVNLTPCPYRQGGTEVGGPGGRTPQKADSSEAYLKHKNTWTLSVRPSDHHLADHDFALNAGCCLAGARGGRGRSHQARNGTQRQNHEGGLGWQNDEEAK